MAWSGWEKLGGTLTEGPSVSSWAGERLDVFVRGTDNAVWHKWFSGGWSGWESLGGSIQGAPAAVSWARGRIDLFARGMDNALWHRWYDGAWSGWERLGGVLASAPTVCSWAPERLDVFGRGPDGSVCHKWYDGAWSAWEGLGGRIQGAPAAVSWTSGRIDLFGRGMNNALWHRAYGGTWSGWEDLGGTLSSAPAASSWAPGQLDVFARGGDGGIWHKWYGGRWSAWELLGSPILDTPAGVSWGLNRIDVFVRAADNALWHRWWSESTPTVRLHVKVLTRPTRFTIDRMVDNMIDLYASNGVAVHRVSDEDLVLPDLDALDAGSCDSSTTQEQKDLLANRTGVGTNDVVAFFCASVTSTEGALNGCAAFPSGKPGAAIASIASEWTLAHEIGHVLGLPHADTPSNRRLDRLMTGGGTDNITNPPPDLTSGEVSTMNSSSYTQDQG